MHRIVRTSHVLFSFYLSLPTIIRCTYLYLYIYMVWYIGFFIWLEFDLKVLWEATPICSASKCARCSPLSAPWCSQCPSWRGSSLCLARSCLHICIYKEHTYSSSRVAGREQRNIWELQYHGNCLNCWSPFFYLRSRGDKRKTRTHT